MRAALLLAIATVTVPMGFAQDGAALPKWSNALLTKPADWYATEEARAVADRVARHQSEHGAWPKNRDLTGPPVTGGAATDSSANTIDNDATTSPVRFLASVASSAGGEAYRAPVLRGVDYLLKSQYDNGGWPQFFPLREGYYRHITFNDNAMINVMTLLREVSAGRAPFAWVDSQRRQSAARAVSKGIDVILRAQVTVNGRLTAWCAQHDAETLKPAWARNFEPPTLSGSESVGIVRFLMDIDSPSPAVVLAVESAVTWMRAVEIRGKRVETFTNADGKRDRRIVADENAAGLWARFYEIGTNKPVFTGRDKVMRAALAEIEYERRNGYAYAGTWPASLLGRDYPRWLAKRRAAAR